MIETIKQEQGIDDMTKAARFALRLASEGASRNESLAALARLQRVTHERWEPTDFERAKAKAEALEALEAALACRSV